MKIIKSLLSAFLLLIFLSGCQSKSDYRKVEGMIWNTLYHITYKGPESLKDSILPVLDEVGASLSVFDSNSLVSRLNAGDSIVADIHLLSVYQMSKKVSSASHGHFDPTVSPLVDAWGFGLGHTVSADTVAIDSILNFVGIDKTYLHDATIVKLDPRTRFNFSAIAKGYGCDAVGEMFRRNGVDDYMVEIGGELALRGQSPSGGKWRIAIDAPEEGSLPGESTSRIIEVTDCGVATSGNYRNFREEGGVKTAHTISPITGRPVLGEVVSATVIAPTCMEADALATACMAGSEQEARDLLRQWGVEGYILTE